MSKINLEVSKGVTIRNNWEQICTAVGADDSLQHAWFDRLTDLYCESTRHYHTLDHIRELLSTLQSNFSSIKDYNAVALAIWFHDAIYDVKKTDNEMQSARLWKEFAEAAKLDEEFISKVSKFIILTQTHKTEPNETDTDLQLFLDMDMLILASSKEDYQVYANRIRKEWSHIPLVDYQVGRTKFLQSCVQHCPFITTSFIEAYAERAKENMLREIIWLPSLTE